LDVTGEAFSSYAYNVSVPDARLVKKCVRATVAAFRYTFILHGSTITPENLKI